MEGISMGIARVPNRNIVHCPETSNDGIFLVADTFHKYEAGNYVEKPCADVITEAAQRHLQREYLKLKG